jgi:eukaryotic-like serine/threonine-protein kinase
MNDNAPPPPPLPSPSPGALAAGTRDATRWQIGPAGGIELDELTLELRRGGQPVAIEPKPLELLMLLVRQPGTVVTKDELLDQVWAGRVVSESVLTKCVAKLREALGDTEQTLIKTVHGFGYRLMAPVLRLGAVRAPPVAAAAWLQAGAAVPLRANWRLVSRYEGARGENWLAEQVKTGEKRVFKFARDGAALTALKREITLHRLLREALGPRQDIVRVLDWNLDELPYFVELDHCSEGSVAEWAQRAGGIGAVPLATRLDIVARTAEALAAAHSVGVLHKDIKPGNVLIELDAAGAPRVRLGDFGSAQVLDDERLRALDITRMGLTQTLLADETTSGTWAYLAPEVIAGQPPTVQSDLYALGAMLYQMVVGDLRRPLAPGWERDVDDPLLREDVAVCCDQEPARRLGDAAELGRRLRTLEVRREARLAQERAAADAKAAREALRRSRTRRSWLLTVTGISLAAALVTGMQYVQVERAREEAQRQAAAARSVNEFLVQDLIGAANPVGNFGVATPALPNSGQVPVRELLDRASVRVGERFAGQPALESAVRSSLGGAYDGLSAYKEAAREYEASARLAATSATRDRSAEAQTLLQAGIALINTDEVDQAEARWPKPKACWTVSAPRQGWRCASRPCAPSCGSAAATRGHRSNNYVHSRPVWARRLGNAAPNWQTTSSCWPRSNVREGNWRTANAPRSRHTI